MQRILLGFLVVLLSACASVPQPLRGEFADVAPAQGADPAAKVRWGGRVIEVLTSADQTCLEILGLPLDPSARPRLTDTEIGRFRACKSGFLDPAVFTQDREITITGQVVGEDTRQVGEYSYRMPRVAVDSLMLWPDRPDPQAYYLRSDPFFWNHPWWPSPRIIVLPPRGRGDGHR